ncbi:MAG TPA: ATP-binding cassette domain-containing protein [Thermaerobacter sp.]
MALAVIEVEDLRKRFGQVEALRGISFQVDEGEIFGLLGPNGAGKTTTLKILATLVRPTAGRVCLNGFDVVREPAGVRRSIGMVFQDPSLDHELTAEQNLWFRSRLYGLPRRVAAERIDEVVAMVDLQDRRRDRVSTFSGGMRRRLEIAAALVHRPRVLFLDEPTVGLDPQTRRKIWDFVRDLRRREGVTVLMTTHYMDEAEHCDRIAVIDHGRIVALDTPAALKRRVGGDIITLTSPDPERLVGAIRERFGAELGGEVRTGPGDEVVVEHLSGAEFVPRVAGAFPDLIRSVSVRQPTLDDVFLKLTGHAIRDEQAGDMDRMRLAARMWRGRGR